jgi:hypothetical protein
MIPAPRDGHASSQQPTYIEHVNLFRWIADFFGFVAFMLPMRRKDERGKVPGFIYGADDLSIHDYLNRQPFGRSVFISFERGSLELAERFEKALRSEGLMPWRYEPADTRDVPLKTGDNMLEQIKAYREHHPAEAGRLTATVRRCTAVLFLVSAASLRSAFCNLEAFVAGIIHTYGDDEHASVYVVLEQANLSPPVFVSKFWTKVYEPDLEYGVAAVIASEIDRQAAKIEMIERRRGRIYR